MGQKQLRYLSGVSMISSCCLVLSFMFTAHGAQAANWRAPELKLFEPGTEKAVSQFDAFNEKFTGGTSVAVCDLDGDNIDEIVVGAGPGGGPQVRIFDANGNTKFTPGFFAYGSTMKSGINVSCGDLDNDHFSEIVTAPKTGGAPQVRVFNRFGQTTITTGFFAYERSFRGGVNLAIGDLDGGGLPEIITAPVTGYKPQIKLFNRHGDEINSDIMPFHPNFFGGVSIATANVDGGTEDELITGVQSGDSALVKVTKIQKVPVILAEFVAFPKEFKGGVNVGGGDIDNDRFDEVIVSANSGGGPQVRCFEGDGREIAYQLFAYESTFTGGVQVASGNLDGDSRDEIITGPATKASDGTIDKIVVDLSEQRLYAYDNDQLARTFLVSTGIPGMDTRVGTFSISQKVYSKLYSGPGYYLPNTLWNMRFDGSRLLHGAYWHNDFGRRKSHGCVNIAYRDAEWLYNLTPIGTSVIIQP